MSFTIPLSTRPRIRLFEASYGAGKGQDTGHCSHMSAQPPQDTPLAKQLKQRR